MLVLRIVRGVPAMLPLGREIFKLGRSHLRIGSVRVVSFDGPAARRVDS